MVSKINSPTPIIPASKNIPEVNVNIPRIVGPTKPPSAAKEFTKAIPTGAVDSVKKKVK